MAIRFADQLSGAVQPAVMEEIPSRLV